MPIDETENIKLSRWEKRKLAVAVERQAELEAVAQEKITPEELQLEQQEQEAILTANREAAEAVDIEKLNEDSDMSVFWKEGVPELLKKKAMMTLWRSNPIFANIDGLVDYDDDFANPDLIMKTFESAYQTGRGYVEHVKNQAKKSGLIEDEGVVTAEEGEVAGSADVAELDAVEIEASAPETQFSNEGKAPGHDHETAQTAESAEEESEEYSPPKVSLRRRFELETET